LAASLTTLATALLMPLVLNLSPVDGNPLPSPLAATAADGVPTGRLA
jgi:hypothetical protein